MSTGPKDSTARKQDYKNWKIQTETFYKIFENFAESLSAEVDEIYGTIRNEDKNFIIKFMGDAAFVFYPHSYATSKSLDSKPSSKVSTEILKKALAFRTKIHELEELGDMKLKFVCTYLTGLYPVEIGEDANRKSDILGRGIDFTARLEKYASYNYSTINSMLYEAISPIEENNDFPYPALDIGGLKYHFIPCFKHIKGWEGEQCFYLMLSKDNFAMEMPVVSPDRNDVEAELLTFDMMNREAPDIEEPDVKKRQLALGSLQAGDKGGKKDGL